MTVSIAIADSTKSFDLEYSYLVPEGMVLKPGARVLVPFGPKNSLREGWVIFLYLNSSSATEVKIGSKTKKIRMKYVDSLIDSEPLLGADLLKLAHWMRGRYFCTWHQALSVMIPAGARLLQSEAGSFTPKDTGKTKRAMTSLIQDDQLFELIKSGDISKQHHLNVLETLIEDGVCSCDALYQIKGVNSTVLRQMVKKGWISESRVKVERDPLLNIEIKEQPVPVLTEDQTTALDKLLALLGEEPSDSSCKEALLFGVTGSGKTELYIRIIEKCLQKGRGAIMLVPEISLTPQAVERFVGRFGARVAVLHSRLSMGEKHDQWKRIKSGELDVVIGARSAVFAPLANLGIVIIDEEHENAYKAENTPRYDARLVSRARCNVSKALLLYGSATPSVETFYRAVEGKISRIDLAERATGIPMPEVTLVDMKAELINGNRSIFSNLLDQELARTCGSGEQAIIFMNRRGYASLMLCKGCGDVVKCPNCTVSLVLHKNRRLLCHHCGHLEVDLRLCPKCKEARLEAIGIGTQRIEKDLEDHINSYTAIRMDLDTTSGKDGHRKLLDAFRNGEAKVLVGTQMVAKGHDFPNVTLVGILSADSMLAIGDWRATERTFQLIAQAAGRAGRAEKAGRVVVQAYNTDNYSLVSASKHDYEGFYRQEIMLRQKLQLPPFLKIGLVLVSATEDEKAKEGAKIALEALLDMTKGIAGIIVTEVMPTAIQVLNGKYRYKILVRHTKSQTLQTVLSQVITSCSKLLSAREAELTVDIDPVGML